MNDNDQACAYKSSRGLLPREDDVFFCPGMDLPAMGAGQSTALNFCGGPQFLSDRLAARR
jgi:hypothetical protein